MSIPNKKVINGWAMYDWANSVYNLVITTTFFPIYFIGVTQDRYKGDHVPILGMSIKNSALFDYALSFAYLLIVISLPILSSIADTRGNKKNFLRFFTYLGSIACSGLFFFDESNVGFGIACLIIAAMGYSGGLVFYNSYLPEIAPVEYQDRVSARGYTMGYIGSVLLQLVGFGLVLGKDGLGITAGMALKITFLLVGLWWIGFAQITFFRLPPSLPTVEKHFASVFTEGFIELKKVYAQVRKMSVLKRYLRGFFFYSMGVQTVMMVATIFGTKELKLKDSELIGTVVAIQLVAILGAWGMARLSERYGNFQVLIGTVLLWIGVCVGAYFTHTVHEFYVLAVLVGLVMGGIQSLSRSTYAKLIPETKDTTSFFSYYDVTEKLAIVIGLFCFGWIDQEFGMRNSVLILIVFFSTGLIWLFSALYKQRRLAI